MNSSTGSLQHAIVGRGEDIEWFDTMLGERMVCRSRPHDQNSKNLHEHGSVLL
jgi:hypothetical protein